MSYINLPSDQQAAISDVDETVLRAAVHKCLDEERTGPIHGFGFSHCGPYVATKLHGFQQAIAEYSKAKSHAKRERTRQVALRAGSDLALQWSTYPGHDVKFFLGLSRREPAIECMRPYPVVAMHQIMADVPLRLLNRHITH